MSGSDARYHLDKTRRKFMFARLAELLLSSVAVIFIALCALLILGTKGFISFAIAIGTGIIFFAIRAIQLNVFGLTNAGVASYLNRHYPSMEEAADLILKDDEELTSVQQLQKNKSISHLSSLYPSIKIPIHFWRPLLIVVVSALAYILIDNIPLIKSEHQEDQNSKGTLGVIPAHASIAKVEIQITPPPYTKIAPSSTNNLNLHVPEGSVIEWSINFEGEVANPRLIFAGNDSVKLNATGTQRFIVQRSISTSSFYNIAWNNKDGSAKASDFYQVEVIKDHPPIIAVGNLNQFTEFDLHDRLKVDLQPTLTDDYSLTNAYIIATVSKGSGESIKFRELKMSFDRPAVITGLSVKPSLMLDILRLGLEPGDELYFYIEALDNKVPTSNRSRTETYFISLRDTSSVSTSVDAGLGVDLLPEYFRSQRQIIIDSEKLLKDKKSISKEAFNARSNSLAYDQKVLRLRYGEFLGEEFESGIGPQVTMDDDYANETDITKQYGHVHDKDNEHNLVDEKKSAPKDGHDHGDDNPVKEFTHSHDSQEEATFFTQSIRAKLKAAITIMWDAELHLRLYDPEKSLPYQYRALKLLKEISQDSRVYVHRTGFEPPPLKEEKRLTGDLAEIKSATSLNEHLKKNSYPDIRRALQQIEVLLASGNIVLTPKAKSDFEAAGQELASVAIQQPGRYLKTLSSLKALSQNELDAAKVPQALLEVRKSLWRLIPVEAVTPQTSARATHSLDDEFLENLEQLKRE